jgi:hypothetical protein
MAHAASNSIGQALKSVLALDEMPQTFAQPNAYQVLQSKKT